MAESIPASIIACLEQLGEELTTWIQAHPDGTLATHEQGVLQAVRQVLPGLLGAVVQASTRALAPAQRRFRESCPGCGLRTAPRKQWRRRQVRTVCGPIHYERPCYWCRGCHRGWSAADATLAVLPRARLSAGLDAWLGELGAAATFAPAAALLERLTGLEVSAETVRQHAEQQGAALDAAQHTAITRCQATRAAAEPGVAAPGLLVVQTDGVMVPYADGYHEAKVGLVAGWAAERLVAPSYVAAREPAAAFGPRLLTEAARRGALEVTEWTAGRTGPGLAHLRPVVVLGDGAPWIWHLAAEHFGECREIVDWYHASAHVWALAHVLYGVDTEPARTWATARLGELHDQGAPAFLQALRQVRPTTPEGRKALRLERGYFRTNQARMAYPTFRALGLPIGSGAVESTARHLVQLRLKRPGARWSQAGAQAIMTLRAHLLSRPTRSTRSGEWRRRRAQAAAPLVA